jgi:hypothetical protein
MMNDPARGQGPGEIGDSQAPEEGTVVSASPERRQGQPGVIGDSVEEAEEGTGAMGGPEPEPPTD